MFVPKLALIKSIGENKNENFDELFNREVIPFLNYNSGVRVINFEIVPARIDKSYTNIVKLGYQDNFVACLIIYFDGYIQEPPAGVIQPRAPPIDKTCTLL